MARPKQPQPEAQAPEGLVPMVAASGEVIFVAPPNVPDHIRLGWKVQE